MLIKTIKAKNFMKYYRLEIGDLSDKNFIGIFGENESGKSTIGEVVSFALFGATARYNEDSLESLINWDYNDCEVFLTFLINDKEYTVVRYIDRQGTHNATLYRGKKIVITKGSSLVTKEIEKLTNFDFDSFRYTFYLAQKEIDLIIKEKKKNTVEILNKMLGFDRIEKAERIIEKNIEDLKNRKEKCENELLVTRSLVKNIKVDTCLEKNLIKKLEENRRNKKKLEEKIKEVEKNYEKAKILVKLYQNIVSSFDILEKSFYYNFHRERLSLSLKKLANIYKLLKNEENFLKKDKKQLEQNIKKFKSRVQKLENFRKELQELNLLIQSHYKYLKKRVTIPTDEKITPTDNLLLSLQNEEKKRIRISKKSIIYIILLILCIITALYSFINIFLIKIDHPFGLKIDSIETILVGILLTSVIFIIFFFLNIFELKKALEKVAENQEKIKEEIEKSQKEIEICKSLNINQLNLLKEKINNLNDEDIINKFNEIYDEYEDIFRNYKRLKKIENEIKEEEENLNEKINKLSEKLAKIENLIQLIDKLFKDENFEIINNNTNKDLESRIENLSNLENEIYEILKCVEQHRGSLKDYSTDLPPEIDKAWQEYEKHRNKFREISQLYSIGGGIGMLNRLQVVYKNKDLKKLFQSFSIEKENLFNSLPKLEDLQNEVKEIEENLNELKNKLNECNSNLKELEVKFEKCEEELSQKRELISKISGLNKQIQEIEHSLKVHFLTKDMLKETLNNSIKRFGPAISKVMSKVLPRFTKGRYQHVQVSDDLVFKAFSVEKNDFVELSELSGGTVDQLFISLRLAFSQAIITAKLGKECKQFLFFDEPIISFDEERSYSFLDLISDYNKNFTQVFLISPRAYEKEYFDLIITTDISSHELIINSNLNSENNTKKNKKITE